MKYERFEDLPCWQKARELCRAVFALIDKTPLGKDFSLRDQIWRSSGSVMDNIAEGFDDGSIPEFRRFLKYAQRSSSEVQSQLVRAWDCGHITEAQMASARQLAEECRKQLKAFRRYLENRTDDYGVAEDSTEWVLRSDPVIPASQPRTSGVLLAHSSIPASPKEAI